VREQQEISIKTQVERFPLLHACHRPMPMQVLSCCFTLAEASSLYLRSKRSQPLPRTSPMRKLGPLPRSTADRWN